MLGWSGLVQRAEPGLGFTKVWKCGLEGRRQTLVIPCAERRSNLLGRIVEGSSIPEGSGAGHCREGVCDSGDSRGKRNSVAGETVGITTAVPPLVMPGHCGLYGRFAEQGSQALPPHLPMCVHGRPFVLVERALLGKECHRQGNLPMSCISAPSCTACVCNV